MLSFHRELGLAIACGKCQVSAQDENGVYHKARFLKADDERRRKFYAG